MTLTHILLIAAATSAFSLAFLASRFARAPGWEAQRSFVPVARTAGLYSAVGLLSLGDIPSFVVPAIELQVVIAAAHALSWSRYADAILHDRPAAPVHWVQWLAAAASALMLVPGVGVSPDVARWRFGDTIHVGAASTSVGDLVFVLIAVASTLTLGRFAVAAVRGKPRALMVTLCLAAMLAMGVTDALTTAGLVHLPYLLDAGFLLPVVVISYELVVRFGEDTRALAELRTELEGQVSARTRELEASQRALVRAESLAALGRMAASVAHEVNNPAAAVIANLQFVASEHRRTGSFPGETLECLEESERATQRIARTARQLLDTSRLVAGEKVETAPVSVVSAVKESLKLARPRCPDGVELRSLVRDELWVTAQPEALVQVLVNLVVNAADAIAAVGRGTRVRVSAAQRESRVLITIEDDGPGMAQAVLEHAFEPFFSTKPVGKGTGLGLAVSRGLVGSMGGELRLESTLGVGTRATVELATAEAPERSGLPLAGTPARPRLRLLLVDDDPTILASLERVLRSRYDVECAETVEEALRRVRSRQRFDVVLADVMMPDGGACELQATLLIEAPALASRVVFLTAGITDEGIRRFLEHSRQPVLEKPLDLVELEDAVGAVTAGGSAASPFTAA